LVLLVIINKSTYYLMITKAVGNNFLRLAHVKRNYRDS
jgi:hypothetical protein